MTARRALLEMRLWRILRWFRFRCALCTGPIGKPDTFAGHPCGWGWTLCRGCLKATLHARNYMMTRALSEVVK